MSVRNHNEETIFHTVQPRLSNELNEGLKTRVDRASGHEEVAAGVRVFLEETDTVAFTRHTFSNLLYTRYSSSGDAVPPETRTTAVLELRIIEEGVVHVRFAREGARDDYPIVVPEPRLASTPTVERDEGMLTLRGGVISVSYDLTTLRIVVADRDGAVILAESNDERSLYHGYYAAPLGSMEIGGRLFTCQSFERRHDEEFFGLGERFTELGKRGREYEMWNRDPANTMSTRSYLNVPFFISTEGYGLFLNSAGHAFIDLGSRTSAALTIKACGDFLDYFLFVDSSPKGILRKYFSLMGAPRPTPLWSYGLWMSYPTDFVDAASVMEKAKEIRARNFPTDVLYIDPPWMGVDSLVCTLEWGPKFRDRIAMIDYLHKNGFKLCVWICPYVPRTGLLYEEGLSGGYFVKDASGRVIVNAGPMNFWSWEMVYVDFTNPEAGRWYGGWLQKLLNEGVDVFKADLGELGPDEAAYFNGMNGFEGHNNYTLEFSRVVYEASALVKTDDAMIWCRSGTAGSHRYPVHWAGDVKCDFQNMAGQLRAVLSAGMSGMVFFSHDIGGFSGTKTPDLYVRWFQLGMFTSHARCHSGSSPNYPWHYGRRVEDICRRYLNLRYSLAPHLFSAGMDCCERGEPMMKALYLEYPDDPVARHIDSQFVFCDEFLVAPVFMPEGERNVYLPSGTWYDLWTGNAFEGPRWLRCECPLETMPIFVRAGSLLLRTQPRTNLTSELMWSPLTIEVYPGVGREKRLWFDYHRYATIRSNAVGTGVTVELTGLEDALETRVMPGNGLSIMAIEVRTSRVS